MIRRLRRGAAAISALSVLIVVPTSSHADEACLDPTVNVLIEAEAAVGRPVLQAPSEYALSNIYSQIEQATRPKFVYAEAGPQFTGAFEALLPADLPSPPRAVAAFPSEDIPDQDANDWGGESFTSVTATSAAASSNGVRDLELGDLTFSGAQSWVTSSVECDVITVTAGWSMSDVSVVSGVVIGEIGEEVTLVVAPDGSSAEVGLTLELPGGLEVPLIAGRPLDALTTPIADGGGPTIEVGEPHAEANADGGSASGGGINFLLLDPATSQGAGARIGSIEISIEVLGTIPPPRTRPSPSDDTVVEPSASPPPLPTATSGSGQSPASSATNRVLATEQAAAVEHLATSLTVTTRSWYPLSLSIAMTLALGTLYALARGLRHRFPALDWLLTETDRVAHRFSAVYLRW